MPTCSTEHCQASYSISTCLFSVSLPEQDPFLHSMFPCGSAAPSTVGAPEILAADRLCQSIQYECQHTDMGATQGCRWTRGLGLRRVEGGGPKMGSRLQIGDQSHELE